jgi:hydroxymethylglutaryl-CoA reductase (NADPH)
MSESIESIASDVASGIISLREVGDANGESETAYLRRNVLEKVVDQDLTGIGDIPFDGKFHAENVIGGVSIPVGVVGPLPIHSDLGSRSVYVPLATTEGSLVASVGRGVKVIRESGGVKVRVWRDSMTRAPLFVATGVLEALRFVDWVEVHIDDLRKVVDGTTKYGHLLRILPFTAGNNVWLRVEMSTGDAMGMNMVTLACDSLIEYLERNYVGVRCAAVSGNLCTDKKESATNTLLGRGKAVSGEVLVPKDVLFRLTRTSAELVADLNARKNLLGSGIASSSKMNAHFANIVAAMFIATGQDPAQVVESSSGYTWVENRSGDLYMSITMPCLEVGVIGGGTQLRAQHEALGLIGAWPDSKDVGRGPRVLAETICAATLAGELNVLCALAAGRFGEAHRALGR